MSKEVTENLDKVELGIALQKIYEFIWEEFCDWYIEMVKSRLYDREHSSRLEAQYVLNYVLKTAMKLLHPFMPFVTEEIYQHLVIDDPSIMISQWPEYNKEYNFPQDEENMVFIMDATRNIRNIRSELNVPPSKRSKVIFVTREGDKKQIIRNCANFLEKLAWASEILIQEDKTGILSNAASTVLPGAEVYIPLEELIDIDKEIERLEKEKANLQKELDRVNNKLNNPNFVLKAPEKVVEEEGAKKVKYQEMYDKVVERKKGLRN